MGRAGGGGGFCLHPGINHSLCRRQTCTPFSPLSRSARGSQLILPPLLSIFPSHPPPPLFHCGLIYSSFPEQVSLPHSFSPPAPTFSHRLPVFSLCPPTPFFLCCVAVSLSLQSPPPPQCLSLPRPPQLVFLIYSKHLSNPEPLSSCHSASLPPRPSHFCSALFSLLPRVYRRMGNSRCEADGVN